MGTGASVDSSDREVAFPENDSDDDVFVTAEPGAAAVPNKPVHRDTKFFLDALMNDDKFENALVKGDPVPNPTNLRPVVEDSKTNDAATKVTSPEESSKTSEEAKLATPASTDETKIDNSDKSKINEKQDTSKTDEKQDKSKTNEKPVLPEPKFKSRYTLKQGEKFQKEIMQDVEKLKKKLAEPPANATKRVTKKGKDGKSYIYESREDGSVHIRFSETSSRTEFSDKSTIETSANGGTMYKSGDGKQELHVSKSGVTKRSGTAFDAVMISDPQQGILDRDDKDAYTTQWDFRQKIVVENHPKLGSLETHPDKSVHIFPDGTQLCFFTNGNKMVFYKDQTIVQCYPDGTFMKKMPDDTTLQFNPDGMIIETNADGGRTQTSPDGTVIKIFKDGSRTTLFPSGARMVSSAPPNVVHTTTFIDGTVSEKYPDGRVVQTSPDGSKIVTDANGKKTEYHSDGAVVEHNPAGSLPVLKVKLKGPASASSPRGKTSITEGTSNATASRPKETATASRPKETATASRPNETATASRPKETATASRPKETATASRPKETATASRPKETAKAMTSAADDDYDDFLENSDEIDSPNENAKTLYNILTDGTKALKFVNRREVDLTWRNPDDKSNTVLMMACKVGTPQIVKVLVDKKADVTYSNSRKTTPLHVACRRGHTQIAKILLDSKADPAACSKYGTPLYEAQKKSSKTSTQRKRDNLLKALSSRLQTT